MKKLVLVFLLLIPFVEAIYFGGLNNGKTATFISKYNSRSMDPQTLDYYEKLREKYNIYIIQDISVASNSQEWRIASNISDLIFITSLSTEVMNVSRENFCKNLAIIQNKSVGVIFAGNSLTFIGNSTSNISSCIYTKYFNFAYGMNNTGLIEDEIEINTSHEMIGDYFGGYKLGEEKTIYPVISPIKPYMTVGKVRGDPDGSGPLENVEYPLIVLWRGMGHNTVSFGLTTSSLSGCENCLGWEFLNTVIDWITNKDNMGFDIETDKEIYYVGERISIKVSSDIEMMDVKGKIVYPGGKSYDLFFTGSSREWNGYYLLQDEDPAGEYTLSIKADGVELKKKIQVKVMDIILSIDNRTENVGIRLELKDKAGNYLDGSKIFISITKPSGKQENFLFNNTSSISMVYNSSESGKYWVYLIGQDFLGRQQNFSSNFSVLLRLSLDFVPENITETLNGSGTIFKVIQVKNIGNENATNIVVDRGGEIKDWINLTKTSLNLSTNMSTQFSVNISVPETWEGLHTGYINFTTDRGTVIFPIYITLDYIGNLHAYPTNIQLSMKLNERKEVVLTLNNSGRGETEIKSIEASGELKDFISVSNVPRIIGPGGNVKIPILISTEGLKVSSLVRDISWKIVIETDRGVYGPEPEIKVRVYSDISSEVEKFYPDLISIEKRIDKLKEKVDVSEFVDEVSRIRSKIVDVQDLYERGEIDEAYSVYQEIESGVNDLKQRVENKESDLMRKKRTTTNLIIFLVVAVILGLIGYRFYKKSKESKEYGWLYKKWKLSIISVRSGFGFFD
ncbi:MAG: FeoB-associated Cys-rich membrane protein [Candidatus Aenigmatarchaeota archaeon]